MGAKVAGQWLLAASAVLFVGCFGVLMVGIGLVVLKDHRVSTNLLAGSVLALGMSLLLSSLLTASLNIWAFGLAYIVLGIIAAVLSAVFFAIVSSPLSRRVALTLP